VIDTPAPGNRHPGAGNVQDGQQNPDGIIPVVNEIVPEEVLRRCPMIDRDDEPFSVG